jgi:dienelactone hydrolase
MPFRFAERLRKSGADLAARIPPEALPPASRRRLGLVWAILLASTVAGVQAADPKQTLDELLRLLRPSTANRTARINPHDRSWEDWAKRSGELPPDFDLMPSIPGLPEPHLGSPADWARERQRIRALFEKWLYGKMPPPPGNLRAVVTGTHMEHGVSVRDVRLEFGPGHRATLRLQVLVPPGKGPFPVFMTNHPRTRPWVATAVRRGYIGLIYFAADPMYGNPDDSDQYIEIYPEYDFSGLARWAWAGMRAVDYLHTLPEVDKARIAVTGHSRNGKQALLAAAFDERIAAVIPSSGNTGEGNPWRYTTEPYTAESVEDMTSGQPGWFLPRLRFFTGREDKLPVDQNLLMALVAPRAMYLYSAYGESQGNPFGFEQAYRGALKVYQHLGAADKLWLHLRDGEHPTTAEDIENFVDFLDTVFGRKRFPKRETFIHGYTFERWKQLSGESIDPSAFAARKPGGFIDGDVRQSRAGILQRIAWALGEEPAGLRFPARRALKEAVRTSDGWMPLLYGRPLKAQGMASTEVAFGDDLKADLYYPEATAAGRKLPVVIWLHSLSYATGYSRYARTPFSDLVRRGFAVLAFDQIGFGTRVRAAKDFYERYPRWSLMGKMVADTRAAVDAAAALEITDPDRIYVVGYSLGAKVGLLAAAMDERVNAVAAVAGFEPLRLATADRGVEGIAGLSHLHGLMPRLGFFVGHEGRVPFDFDEAAAAIAPRPLMVVAPTMDRYARIADVRAEMEHLKRAYELAGQPQSLRFETPVDFNRFTREMQTIVFDWLAGLR